MALLEQTVFTIKREIRLKPRRLALSRRLAGNILAEVVDREAVVAVLHENFGQDCRLEKIAAVRFELCTIFTCGNMTVKLFKRRVHKLRRDREPMHAEDSDGWVWHGAWYGA